VDDLIAKDEARRAHVQELQVRQERRNAASKEIGKAMASGDAATAEALKAEVASIKEFIQNGEKIERELDKALNDALGRDAQHSACLRFPSARTSTTTSRFATGAGT
jgi:seryl-tRNA synthetase